MIPKPAESHVFTAADDSGSRLDLYLSERLELSRSQIKRLLTGLTWSLGNRPRLAINCGLECGVGGGAAGTGTGAETAHSRIIYEDEDLAGSQTQGLGGASWGRNLSETLVNACSTSRTSPKRTDRPGIVHRLDKDTSGLMLVLHDRSHAPDEPAQGTPEKHYLALVHNMMIRADRQAHWTPSQGSQENGDCGGWEGGPDGLYGAGTVQ